MSFRKRSLVVPSAGHVPPTLKKTEKPTLAGTRPSPLDGRLTTSTGTFSLDNMFAGHSGLPLGTSLLIEERDTTDFSGTLIRYYVAEGVVQGHHVHVLGVGEMWTRELPGLAETAGDPDDSTNIKKDMEDKIKIAWRYERLRDSGKGGKFLGHTEYLERSQSISFSTPQNNRHKSETFCHNFDLSKRLVLPSPSTLNCIPMALQTPLDTKSEEPNSYFKRFLQHLDFQLSKTPSTIVHRVAIPSLLSPTIYPHFASNPSQILQFLHTLRALLRKYPNQLTALFTLPISLYPRSTGLTRWMETLSDGVIEMASFKPESQSDTSVNQSGSAKGSEEIPQGIIKVHRLPIIHEKGGGGGESMRLDDMAFVLNKRKGLIIRPFSLPPIDGGTDTQQNGSGLDYEVGKERGIEF